MSEADQLPDSNPSKKVGMEFIRLFEGKYGPGTSNPFAAYAYDSVKIIEAAVPTALKRGKPGTAEFRQALRDAVEGLKNVPGTHGVYSMSPTNHNGMDERARVMVRVQNGNWTLIR